MINKLLSTSLCLTFLCVANGPQTACAGLMSVLVDSAGSPSSEGLSNYLSPVEWSAFIDPDTTNWIALHSNETPSVHSSLPGQEYVGGRPFVHWIGLVNDFLDLTITNTSTGSFQTIRMDYNNGIGNESGPQSIIYGLASDAPDVHRLQDPFGSRTWVTYDEAGAFNSFFTTAATYDFRMTYGNTGGGSFSQDHDNIYFLVDTVDSVIPEPSSIALFSLGSLGLGFVASRRKKSKQV